jgi:acetyl-CoA carboxylase biotin carboxylase subunit
MRRALDEFVIEGIKTTIPFHRLMDDPRYIAGRLCFYGYFKMDDL